MTTTWQRLLDQHAGPAMRALLEERRQHVVYPELKDVYRAFDLCPFDRVRAVVLAQDPYSGWRCLKCKGVGHRMLMKGWDDFPAAYPCDWCDWVGYTPQGNGLAFSVPRGVPIPPSLRNIYREIERSAPKCMECVSHEDGEPTGVSPQYGALVDCSGCSGTGNAWKWRTPDHGDLTAWAERGVLLLNSALSCRAGQPGSHAKIWRQPVTELLRVLWQERQGVVWLAWGRAAQKLLVQVSDMENVNGSPVRIDMGSHLILTAPHPDDRRNGIVGSNCFVEANRWFALRGDPEIDWRL